MKNFKKNAIVIMLAFALVIGFSSLNTVQAATAPSLGLAATYGILSSTYTNTVAGTTVTGDIGFTTGPAVAPVGVHANYGSGAPFATAGIDQGSALANLNSQACTFTFANGAIDLATDATHGPIGVYTPGVYCTGAPGAATIGAGGITLNGAGTYIFRINGALTSVANSVVTLAGGASACDVFWTPTSATTLGANSIFKGTDIDASGITVGNTVNWVGRALAFGGTVTTDVDNISVPSCSVPPPVPPVPPSMATLHVIKQVVNNSGGTAVASAFNLHLKLSGTDVSGSPAVGTVAPGTSYTLAAGTYTVSEDANSLPYIRSFTGDCDSSGSITLVGGDNKTCTLVNDDIEPAVIVPPVVTPPVVAPAVITPVVVTPPPVVPKLPKTGFAPKEENSSWNIIISAGILGMIFAFYLARRKQTN
ncbi:MAG: ice-binding family protein [Candidatus Paceibacterota bacterium]|jgi:hypothetical protein